MKYLSQQTYEFDPPDWFSFRTKERRCIRKELHNIEYGEVVFPRYYGSREWSWYTSARLYYSLKKIRNDYCEEIRSILNGYVEKGYFHRNKPYDLQEVFINDFNLIKNGNNERGHGSQFEWLNYNKVKEAVKKWQGEPLDILYHLNRTGLIEQAVRMEAKRMLRK
jgi:hypothetical protein